jgi:hypothetical protein
MALVEAERRQSRAVVVRGGRGVVADEVEVVT